MSRKPGIPFSVWAALGTVAGVSAATRLIQAKPVLGSRSGAPGSGAPFKFSLDTCPAVHEDIVDWSTDNWWHPVPVTEIEWPEFRDAVQITPESVSASGYLGWQPGWEPFEEFLAREPGGGTQTWFKGALPSGTHFYVWAGSGIEHWWTPNGEPIDQDAEREIIDAIYEPLEQLEERRKTTVMDTLRLIMEFRANR